MATAVKKKFPKWTEVEDMLAELQRRTNDVRQSVAAAGIAPGAHNLLAGLQGGAAGQYFHLTNAEHTALTTGVNADAYHSHAHNATTGIQGGAAGDYFHFTNAAYTAHTTNVLADAYHRHDLIYDSGNVAAALSSDAAANLTLAGAFVPTVIVNDSANQAPLRLTERAAAPAVPVANDIYVDDGTGTASGLPGWRRYTGAVWEDMGAIVTAPAGANTQVQYNNAGAFGADANFTWSGTTLRASANAGFVNVATGYEINTTTVLTVAATNNLILGLAAGAAIIAGATYNTFLGDRAGNSLTTADYCTLGGYNAGQNINTGGYNTCYGATAGAGITTEINTTYIGYGAGGLAVATENTGVGIYALYQATGAGNVAVGASAGVAITIGSDNTLVGHGAGISLVDGNDNVVVGGAGGNLTSGSQNFAMGELALAVTTVGNQNIAIGADALRLGAVANTIGIGYQAFRNMVGTTYSMAIGDWAGLSHTAGDLNIYLGVNSGRLNRTGSNNVVAGVSAGYGIGANSYSNNVFLGLEAARNVTTGSQNVCVGRGAGHGIGANNTCVIIGYLVGTTAGFIGASSRYMVDISDRADPLVNGDFANRWLQTNGNHYIPSDTYAFWTGASNDFKMWYDGTDAWLETDKQNASDLIVACGADKTLELEEEVWDDYVTPLGPNNWNGASNNPVLTKFLDDGAGSQGIYYYVWTNDDEALYWAQLPHKYKEGTDIYPHIHFVTTSDVNPSDNFGIQHEYAWADIDEDFPANSTLETLDIPTGVNTDTMHQFANITAAGLNGANFKISSILMGRIKRVAASADDYADGVAIIDFDIHYEIDTMGSRQIVTK